jgi:hypothetical protein
MDLLIGFVLYAAYRIAIMNKTDTGDGLLETITYFLDIALNLVYSLLYLTIVVICSFTVLLNFIREIRNSPFFSWLSFSGAPILLVVMFIINLWLDGYHYSSNVMTKLLIFAILYPCITTILYLQFRKKFRKLNNTAVTNTVAGI